MHKKPLNEQQANNGRTMGNNDENTPNERCETVNERYDNQKKNPELTMGELWTNDERMLSVERINEAHWSLLSYDLFSY